MIVSELFFVFLLIIQHITRHDNDNNFSVAELLILAINVVFTEHFS